MEVWHILVLGFMALTVVVGVINIVDLVRGKP